MNKQNSIEKEIYDKDNFKLQQLSKTIVNALEAAKRDGINKHTPEIYC